MSTGAQKSESWTIERVVSWATEDFRARGLESPRLEAELLLGHALGLSRIQLILERGRPLSSAELATYRDQIKRRRGGEPVSYILGSREFFGLPFRVTPAVLIPRPDTEALVEEALERTESRSMFGNLLDLCTGSGCVAIAFARARRTWKIQATDSSEAALAVARQNALNLGVLPQVELRGGDLFQAARCARPFDMIVSNPPYIPSADVKRLDKSVAGFEPRTALDGGRDGLEILRRVVAEAPPFLRAEGALAVEIQYDQGPRVQQLFLDHGYEDVRIRRDYGRRDRVVSGRRPRALGA